MSEQMQPGPEMDAAVVEQLFGWRAKPGWGVKVWNDPDGALRFNAPKSSTDWAAAGQVLERLAELGWSTNVLVQENGNRIAHCTKWEEDKDGEPDLVALTGYFECESAPHAISLAALAVLEISQ